MALIGVTYLLKEQVGGKQAKFVKAGFASKFPAQLADCWVVSQLSRALIVQVERYTALKASAATTNRSELRALLVGTCLFMFMTVLKNFKLYDALSGSTGGGQER